MGEESEVRLKAELPSLPHSSPAILPRLFVKIPSAGDTFGKSRGWDITFPSSWAESRVLLRFRALLCPGCPFHHSLGQGREAEDSHPIAKDVP